jgi:hypothetical protein
MLMHTIHSSKAPLRHGNVCMVMLPVKLLFCLHRLKQCLILAMSKSPRRFSAPSASKSRSWWNGKVPGLAAVASRGSSSSTGCRVTLLFFFFFFTPARLPLLVVYTRQGPQVIFGFHLVHLPRCLAYCISILSQQPSLWPGPLLT